MADERDRRAELVGFDDVTTLIDLHALRDVRGRQSNAFERLRRTSGRRQVSFLRFAFVQDGVGEVGGKFLKYVSN